MSASIGGVIHLNIQKKLGRIKITHPEEKALRSEQIQSDNEIPMQESIDKLTIQIALIAVAYLLAYLLMVRCCGTTAAQHEVGHLRLQLPARRADGDAGEAR